jgi:hypothetical protein
VATNPAIKKALLKKMNVTPQRLSQLVQKRKAELPMSTEQATYTIAHEHGIDLSRELSPEETADVRQLMTALRGSGGAPSNGRTAPTKASRASATGKRNVKVSIAGVDVGKIPALSPTHAADAKIMAEKVYPLIFIFENSVRDLVEHVLKAAFGAGWWTTAVPGPVQEIAKRHKEAEAKDPWHSNRGRREIDYVFLNDLWKIIKHQWAYFKDLFPDQAWVQTMITRDMNVSRLVLAHMNPLAPDDISNIENSFKKWVRQLRAVESKLP